MKHQPLCACHQFFHYSPLPVPGPNPGHHTAFNCRVSLVRFGLWQFFGLSLFLLILTVLSSGQCPIECGPVWVCLMFFLGLDRADALREGVPAREHILVVTSPREVHAVIMMSLTRSPSLTAPWSPCFSHSPLYSLEASHSVEPTQAGGWVQLSFLKLGLGWGPRTTPKCISSAALLSMLEPEAYRGRRRRSRLGKGLRCLGRRLEEARQELPRGSHPLESHGARFTPSGVGCDNTWCVVFRGSSSEPRGPGFFLGTRQVGSLYLSCLKVPGSWEERGVLSLTQSVTCLGAVGWSSSQSPPSPAVQAGLCKVVSGPQW